MRSDSANRREQGFTLVEVLAAFTIASVIIMATAALMRTVVLSFDRGTSRVNGAERLLLAADRLASDIGSARFVKQMTAAGPAAAFLGAPTKITFVGAGGVDPGLRRNDGGTPSQEVVSVTIEHIGDTTEVVRRRGAWRGSRSGLEDVVLRDQVVLVEGLFDASFAFARMNPDGALAWSDSWTDAQSLPRLVKLNLRERASGIDLFGGAEFVIHADAPAACARSGAGVECAVKGAPAQPGAGPATAAKPGQKQNQEEEGPLDEEDADEQPEGPQP
jgi:prepilin-type N-terminal cleavage/methylation domain-containing protein